MERVAFLIESTGERIPCLLNPASLVLRRSAGVRPRRSAAASRTTSEPLDDTLVYVGGGRTELLLDLLFDVAFATSTPPLEDVRQLTLPLSRLAEGSELEKGLRRAPVVRFLWGKTWNFPAVVAALAERYEEFSLSGAPRRSWVRMRLLRSAETAESPQSLTGEGAPGAGGLIEPGIDAGRALSGSELGAPDLLSIPGQRWDVLADRYLQDPTQWRRIADLSPTVPSSPGSEEAA